MNLAVHGLSGDIRQSVTYYEDPHKSVGKFDFVMANPPFNVDKVDKERIKDDPRYPFTIPKADNANYLWIQLFYSSLSETGRAGFVMANSAGDARASELDIRRDLLKSGAVDVMVSVGSNFFYTVTLPCTLWFLDRGKAKSKLKDKVLFIDARNIFTQIDRAHREFTPQQIEFLSNIVRLYRGEKAETECGSKDLMKASFPTGKYADVLGLCKFATLDEIEAQGLSLNPGRYVGVFLLARPSISPFEKHLVCLVIEVVGFFRWKCIVGAGDNLNRTVSPSRFRSQHPGLTLGLWPPIHQNKFATAGIYVARFRIRSNEYRSLRLNRHRACAFNGN